MNSHKFSVGLPTELAPHEDPELLDLNENWGRSVEPRIRTDQYDGFRSHKEVRRVLCPELMHNVWGDHDNNVRIHLEIFHAPCALALSLRQFKELPSQLNTSSPLPEEPTGPSTAISTTPSCLTQGIPSAGPLIPLP